MTAQELYADLTNKIVASLEAGGLPIWRQPWSGGKAGFMPLRHNGLNYRGVNILLLAVEGMERGYTSQTWMTLRQANELGGCVRRGERSTVILFCQPHTKTTTKPDGTEGKDSFWISKTYRVFNVAQIEGLSPNYYAEPTHQLDEAQRIAHADTYIANTGADIHHGNGAAFYQPLLDYISLPYYTTFDSPEAYAATALHELSHWTGAANRLNRDLKGFGSDRKGYAEEEIRSELASVLLTAQLGIAPPSLDQYAAYIGHWIDAMKSDPKYVFSAASQAQRIVDFLNSLQPAA